MSLVFKSMTQGRQYPWMKLHMNKEACMRKDLRIRG